MERVKGYIDHIIFQNRDNGYAVLSFIAQGAQGEERGGDQELVCVGSFKNIEAGETLEIDGTYVEHPVYGRQLKAENYRVVPPDDTAGMERYLGSGAIKGIGEALAARIVRTFKEDTFRIMEQEPERLSEVKGISERKAREIAQQMIEKRDMREAFVFLQQYGISNTLAVKIYNQYGMKLYGIMKENPYQLAEDISGVGFRIADEIASKIGIHTDSDYRIRSGILYALAQAAAEGHTYLPFEVLTERAASLLGLYREAIEPQVDNLAMDRKLVIKSCGEERRVYAVSYYYAEMKCARMLHDLNVTMDEELLLLEEKKPEKLLEKLE